MASQNPQVPTAALFGYLLTVLAWQLELGVLLLYVFGGDALDPRAHAALLLLVLALSTFCYLRGRRDFYWLRRTGGRVAITPLQAVLVTLFVVGLGSILAWVAVRLAPH